jgi:hypothetical protein
MEDEQYDNDEYIEDNDDMDDDEYDEDEVVDEVDEDDLQINNNFKFPPTQVIGNSIIDARGRPQSAKVQAQHNISGIKNYQPGKENSNNAPYPTNAYQYNPGNNYNYPSDALNMIRNYSGKMKAKRPMSASVAGRGGRNNNEYMVGNTLTAQNSKMATEYSKIDIKRMKPKRITQEKEKLYEQTLKFKIQMNSFKDENIKLRTRLKFLEKEQYQKEGIIEDLANNNEITTIGRLGSVGNKKKSESYLATALKRQIKDLKTSLKDKEDEIVAYKKNFRNTKITELDIELRSYMDECLRLRHLLEDTIKSKDPLIDPDQATKIEEQFEQQNAIIANLQHENQELNGMLNHKENETLEWRNLVEEYQKRLNRLRPAAKENKRLKKLNKDKKGELTKIRQELLLLRSKTTPEIKAKVDEMMRKQDDLAGKMGNNKAKMNALKKEKNKLQEQRKEIAENMDQLESEKEQLHQELEEEHNLKKKFEELYSEEREKNLALRSHLDELTKDEKANIPRNQSARPRSASKYGRKSDSNNATKNDDEKLNQGTQDDFGSNASDEKEILLEKVQFSDVESIAAELRKTFQIMGIAYHDIPKILPRDDIGMSDLMNLFCKSFNIDENDSLMAARFIFEQEDEDESKVLFDEDKQLESFKAAERLQAFV